MVDLLNVFQSYIPLSVIVVGLSVLILAIVYQIGRMLSNKGMTDWARYEVYQAFGSLMIIALVAFALWNMNTVLLVLMEQGGFQCSGDSCTYTEYTFVQSLLGFDKLEPSTKTCTEHCQVEIAKSYLNMEYELITRYTAAQICKIAWLELLAEMNIDFTPLKMLPAYSKRLETTLGTKVANTLGKASKLTTRFGASFSISFSPFSGYQVVDESYEIMISFMMDLMGMLKANWMMLTLVEHSIFPLFLVVGIILRILSVTRKLGGLMIAMAITLYFFYPAVVILQSIAISPQSSMFKLEFVDCPGDVPLEYGKEQPDGAKQSMFSFFSETDVQTNQKSFLGAYLGWGVTKPGGLIDATAAVTTWVLVQLIILVYLIAAFIMGLSPLFGGDVDIAGISRLL